MKLDSAREIKTSPILPVTHEDFEEVKLDESRRRTEEAMRKLQASSKEGSIEINIADENDLREVLNVLQEYDNIEVKLNATWQEDWRDASDAAVERVKQQLALMEAKKKLHQTLSGQGGTIKENSAQEDIKLEKIQQKRLGDRAALMELRNQRRKDDSKELTNAREQLQKILSRGQ